MEIDYRNLLPYIVLLDENGKIVSRVSTLNTSNKQYITQDSHGGFYKNLYILESAFYKMPPSSQLLLYRTKESHKIEIVKSLTQE